jgi:hypothetical protein
MAAKVEEWARTFIASLHGVRCHFALYMRELRDALKEVIRMKMNLQLPTQFYRQHIIVGS